MDSILGHRQNDQTNEYEFQVKWLIGKKIQIDWNVYDELVDDRDIMREVYDYTSQHLSESAVKSVRIGMMGSRSKPSDDGFSDGDYQVSEGDDEEEKVQKGGKPADSGSDTVKTGSRPPRKCAPKELNYTQYFEDYFESDLKEEDQQTITDSFVGGAPEPGWWDAVKKQGEYPAGEMPWHQYYQPTNDGYEEEAITHNFTKWGQGALYPNMVQLPLDQIFDQKLWHPGMMSHDVNRCAIDAINMFFGGPVYTSFEQFYEFYSYTKKMKKQQAAEDVAMNGIGLVNLHNVVVLRDKLLSYSPKTHSIIEQFAISDLIRLSGSPGDDLYALCPSRCIIQYVCNSVPATALNPCPPRQSHAACLVHQGKKLYLLDASESKPRLLSGPNGYAKKWLADIEYIAIFEMIPTQYSKSVIDSLADVFERIYRGEKAAVRGGNKRSPISGRRLVSKTDRKDRQEGLASPSAEKVGKQSVDSFGFSGRLSGRKRSLSDREADKFSQTLSKQQTGNARKRKTPRRVVLLKSMSQFLIKRKRRSRNWLTMHLVKGGLLGMIG